jgi:hypothetical protein
MVLRGEPWRQRPRSGRAHPLRCGPGPGPQRLPWTARRAPGAGRPGPAGVHPGTDRRLPRLHTGPGPARLQSRGVDGFAQATVLAEREVLVGQIGSRNRVLRVDAPLQFVGLHGPPNLSRPNSSASRYRAARDHRCAPADRRLGAGIAAPAIVHASCCRPRPGSRRRAQTTDQVGVERHAGPAQRARKPPAACGRHSRIAL